MIAEICHIYAFKPCGCQRGCAMELTHHRPALEGNQSQIVKYRQHRRTRVVAVGSVDEYQVEALARGREFGKRTDDQQQSLVYLGLQITR